MLVASDQIVKSQAQFDQTSFRVRVGLDSSNPTLSMKPTTKSVVVTCDLGSIFQVHLETGNIFNVKGKNLQRSAPLLVGDVVRIHGLKSRGVEYNGTSI